MLRPYSLIELVPHPRRSACLPSILRSIYFMVTPDRSNRHLLNRRQALLLIRTAGTAVLVGCLPRQADSARIPANQPQQPDLSGTAPTVAATTATPACIVTPAQTEGPYFVDEQLNRSDIRSDPADRSVQAGVPLQLTLHVSQLNNQGCAPLAGALVDIWHCNALGVYSDVSDRSFNTVGKKFLRGSQVTDAKGQVQFITIYPGWYPGRTVHIHFKIRSGSASGQNYELTSQLYFDDAVTDRVYAQAPYASNGERTTRNADDGIFSDGGDRLLVQATQTAQGYAATFEIGLQMA